MNPAPNHQPRTPASRADGDARMRSRPGTSANQARNSRLGAGKASTGRAPATRAAYLAGLVRARHNAMAPFLRCPEGGCALAVPSPVRRPAPTSAGAAECRILAKKLRNNYVMASVALPSGASRIPVEGPADPAKGSGGIPAKRIGRISVNEASGNLARPIRPQPGIRRRGGRGTIRCEPSAGGGENGSGALPLSPGGRAAAPERAGGGPGERGEGERHDPGLGPGGGPVGGGAPAHPPPPGPPHGPLPG